MTERMAKELTMTLLIPEIFEKIAEAKTKDEIVQILRKHNSPALQLVLKYGFWPGIKFCVSGIPNYKPDSAPLGMSPSSLYEKIRLFYLFNPSNPTPQAKKETILCQICESVHPTEAEFVDKILKQNFGIPLLTHNLIESIFPGILTS